MGGGPGGGPNCANAALGAAMAAASNTLAERVRRVFIDIMYFLRSRILAVRRWASLARPRRAWKAEMI
jgi:hypothetical protein